MTSNKGLIKIDDRKSIIKFLQAPSLKIAEALTGILASDLNEYKLSTGRLIQASINWKFLSQLGKELKEYAQKGRIKEDYFATHKEQSSLYELLKFIDEGVPDEERFKAMKSIFLISISKDVSKEDKELAYELMKICKIISSSELLILKACYDVVKGKIAFKHQGDFKLTINSRNRWFRWVAEQIGHNLPSLVEYHEENLIKLKLISNRDTTIAAFIATDYFRLTELGVKLCDFISKYP